MPRHRAVRVLVALIAALLAACSLSSCAHIPSPDEVQGTVTGDLPAGWSVQHQHEVGPHPDTCFDGCGVEVELLIRTPALTATELTATLRTWLSAQHWTCSYDPTDANSHEPLHLYCHKAFEDHGQHGDLDLIPSLPTTGQLRLDVTKSVGD